MMTKLLTPVNGETVTLHTERQKYFREHHREMAVHSSIDWLHLVHTGEKDNSHPAPVTFAWEGDADTMELSLHADMTDAVSIPAEGGTCQVYNLYIGTTYWWRAGDSEIGTFTTEDTAPRWIFAEGGTNIRDAGGWKTLDGRRIRQGLLFRGSEFGPHAVITEKGIRTLREEIGIRTDLDFRGEAVGVTIESPLGADIRFFLLPATAYEVLYSDPSNLKEIFTVFADPENYPIYYHCWGGADRTGTYAFLLGSILGMSDEDLAMDYELTSLSVWGCRSQDGDGFRAVLDGIAPYGNTAKERAENFLLEHGVTGEQIESIRRILLED